MHQSLKDHLDRKTRKLIVFAVVIFPVLKLMFFPMDGFGQLVLVSPSLTFPIIVARFLNYSAISLVSKRM